MTKRQLIYNKFGGKCAYSGTELKDDWQIDHMYPKAMYQYKNIGGFDDPNHIDNLLPCQRIINHYKRALPLELFKSWYLDGLHLRLSKLPKKTNSPTTIKRKNYLLEVASYFDITESKPFNGKFYFETLDK
jgi:hypothetical protein